MNKQTTNSGPIGFRWLRSLLEFRHRNPAARFVSTVVAFAMATLLAVGTGVAYGDGTTPTDPTTPSADTSTTSTDSATTADPTTPSDPAPANDPAPVTDPAPPTTGATTDTSTSTTSSTKTSPKATLLRNTSTPSPALSGNADCQSLANIMVGGFEIDGDPCDDEGGIDFNDGPGASTDDLFQTKGDDAFTGGASENQDPSTWATSGPQPTGKADIGTVWGWSHTWSNPGDTDPITPGMQLDPTDGDIFAYFGFTNDSTSGGTQDYSLEFNQHAPSASGLPIRTANDLLFHFDSNGSNALEYVASYVYTLKGAGSLPAGCQAITSSSPAAGWCPKALPAGGWIPKASSTGQYVEAAINISLMFGAGTCSGQYGYMFLRSAPGSYWTSQMKDYVAPLGVSTPSTCASLSIKKYDRQTGALITGAHFRVWAGTNTSASPLYSDLTEGATADKDTTANDGVIKLEGLEPGPYTVREIQAPSGYTIAPACDGTHVAPNCDTQTVTLAASDTTQSLSFYDLKPWSPLTAMKTARGDYTSHYTWDIQKAVRYGADAYASSARKDSSNATENFDWKVSVQEVARTEKDFKVTGAITISNPNDTAVVATVTESLSGCTIFDPTDTTPPLTPLADASAADGFQVSVPKNGTGSGTSYQYECSQSDRSATANQLTVSVNRHSYPRDWDDWLAANNATYDAAATSGGSLSPSITWHDNPDGTQNISVTDVVKGTTTTHANSGAPWTHTWGNHGDPTWNATTSRYEHTYSSPVTATAGNCASVTNTAAITGTALSAEATATHCMGDNLRVTKNRTASLERTYLWQIHKTRTSAASITSGQSASYSVTVDRAEGAGYSDTGWKMTGVITVTNPNTFESVTMTSLVDQYSGDNDLTNSCSVVNSRPAWDGSGTEPAWGAVDLTLEKKATGFVNARDYKYTCTFTNKPDYGTVASPETNTATANWSAAAAATPGGTASGTASVVESDWALSKTTNKVITVVDNQYTGGNGTGGHTLGTANWDDAPVTFTYSMPWTAPAGECVDRPNTATIVETKQESSATVQVCNPVDLTVAKTAAGSYTRTYSWGLSKAIVGDSKFTGDSYDHTFDYLVSLKELGAQDGAWKLDGTITVVNPNDATKGADIPDYTASVTDAMTGVGGLPTCQWKVHGDAASPWQTMPASVTLASGETEVLDYTCSFASQPTYSGGTNKATATWTGGSADSGDVPVSFSETSSIDKTVKVTDDKTSGTQAELPNSPVTYGSHGSNPAWVAEDSAYEFPYSLPLTYDKTTYTPPACQSYPNTAKVLGDRDAVLDTAQATAQICPLAGTWRVSKTVAEPLAVAPGTTLHYTLTAHRTSVVDAKGVVVHDDLSDIAPYITGDPVFSNGDASYDAATHVLTWNVGTLGATDETLDFAVTVKGDAYGVDLPNLITSTGSDNCDPAAEGFPADECKTDNKTPHYTLEKSSDHEGGQVMPPYLSADGTVITYTLTVHNDSDVPINDTTMSTAARTVTDNLTDVLDNAALDEASITGSGGSTATYDPATQEISWILPPIAVGGDATLTYQVTVKADQWNQALTNVAEPGEGGDCVPVLAVVAPLVNPNCTTTSRTPGYGMLQALKLDADTGQPLSGATFALYRGADTTATPLATATSGVDGVALFDVKLRPGDFTIVETVPPVGYDLPSGGAAVQPKTLTEADMDEGDPATQVTFRDPPKGSVIIAKAHQELVGGTWVPSDGTIAFNDQVKYVMTVTATGTKVFHNVKVTDYVPGYDPADTQTQLGGFKAAIVGTPTCSTEFATCTASYDASTGLVTWTLGNVGDKTGTVEFVVRMPDLPRISPLAAPGVAFAGLMWNRAYLSWTQADDTEGAPPHSLASNAVTDAANEVLPPQEVKPPKQHHPSVLPNTGGPDRWLPAAGLALLLAGAALVIGDRRRRHRG